MHEEHGVAAVAIRGTDLDKSLGGDLFTDVNALPERAVGADGAVVFAHSGMLAAARLLEAELRQAVRVLVESGLQVVIVGHSLGAGVAALLTWLFKHGADSAQLPHGARIYGVGYATPSVLDRAAAEAMRPYFTSVVNSVDVVPRLSIAAVRHLADEIVGCARESMKDLDEDMQAIYIYV